MTKQVAADVRLDTDAEGMPPVGDSEVQPRTQQICQRHQAHDDKKERELPLRQQSLH